MSLGVLRDGPRAKQQNEVSLVSRARTSRLRELHAVTSLLRDNGNLSRLLHPQFDIENSPPIDSDEAAWLKSNDLECGRYFDDDSLPIPDLPHHAASIYISKPNTPPRQHSEPISASHPTHVVALEAAGPTAIDSPAAGNRIASPIVHPTLPASPAPNEAAAPIGLSALDTVTPSTDPAVPPPALTSNSPSEPARLSISTDVLLGLDEPSRPAKTVHLPPEHVQEERLRERSEAEDERRKSESDRASRLSHSQGQAELTSSPSSTVGALSAATPLPPQDSPDTSPNSETAEMEVLPPKDLRLPPEEQRAKEEHDRLLAAQKDIALRQARGDDASPDDQLRWEAREAAARDAEEKAAREDVNGPEPDAKTVFTETEAEQSMGDIQPDVVPEPLKSQVTQGEDSSAGQLEPLGSSAMQDEGDNIIVTPRIRLPTVVDDPRPQRQTVETSSPAASRPAAPERRTTRISTGAMLQKSVSEILGETPPSSAVLSQSRGEIPSPEVLSPAATRHSQDLSRPTLTLQTPRHTLSSLPRPSTPPGLLALAELAPLKGAAQDPDRDYLEPLFRIQAHDSPNASTKPLPELVKNAAKYLSSSDQIATSHERLDYRILRRIYQLQNANKWSLRQMEKCKEPDQPTSHQDFMMAEMKWMRKDFKAERKMKKSVCAWLAERCADWIAASAEARLSMQVKVRPPRVKAHAESDEQPPPDLEMSGDSAPEDDDAAPSTPMDEDRGMTLPSILVVPPELSSLVTDLRKEGKLGKALQTLPIAGLSRPAARQQTRPIATVSKFVEGKMLPRATGPIRKRSRYDYEDDAAYLEGQPESKRGRGARVLSPEVEEVALFHPDNKHIRDRLHANNAFRPPSEFVMPSTSFYEFRNGSQWVWEDDQKLRKLAKEYSFNWSLIADELALPSRQKSASDRRTPWECFERWVELETLPAEMRKTMYFKTWFQRLEQSQQAAERRYQAQVAIIQQAQSGGQGPVPMRRRIVPTRVEKRKNARYLWLVDAMRKLARKRESNAYKQAETQRAAAQRKAQTDNSNQPRVPTLTPQEFSKRRHERDVQFAEAQRQHRQKMLEAQQRQLQMARAAQQQSAQNGGVPPQRPGTAGAQPPIPAQMQVNGQPNASVNGQLPQQARPALPLTTRNGHLAVPQVNAQGIPQAQMRAAGAMSQPSDLQRIAHEAAQRNGQQYGGQQFQMPSGNMPSSGGLTTQQQLQINQELLQQQQQRAHQQANSLNHSQGMTPNAGNHRMSSSPSMPPPPTPHNNPQQLSSGLVPAIFAIKNHLRTKHPHLSEEQLASAATEQLARQSQNQASNQVARQNAMNAAAGIPSQAAHGNNMQAYAHNQVSFQNNAQLPNGNMSYANGDAGGQQGSMSPSSHTQQAQAYAQQMRRQMNLMRMGQSPNASHAVLNGTSPVGTHASPNMPAASLSPSMQYANVAGMAGAVGGNMAQRPPSRSNTPQMQRLGSSGGVAGVSMPNGMQSPGALQHGSPRNMQASMAR